jgi:uncharacterized protein YbjT (DUF2867 family)
MEQATQKIRAIVTGATGMVGEGVLHECLIDPQVEAVLVVNRRPGGIVHPKITEVIHSDFFDLAGIESSLAGHNACYFCLGVTSLGKNEEEYYKLTHTLTLNFAKKVSKVNNDMTFCYISGSGTDSTEKGKLMWARVKGKTENDLTKLPFKAVYNIRPGIMRPTKGADKNVPKIYKYLGWLYPVVKTIFPKAACTLKEVGRAVINITQHGFNKPTIEVTDIIALAKDR